MIKRFLLGKAFPLILALFLGLLFALMLLFSRKAPSISSIEPSLAFPGQTVIIRGEYFGFRARDGQLFIADRVPPPSNIQSWSDRQIVLTIPEDARSGLVSVSNSQGASPGVLFTNAKDIPSLQEGKNHRTGQPFIQGLWPAAPQVGRLVQLWGDSFGEKPDNALVRLGGSRPLVLTAESVLAWSDHQISLLLPPGLDSDTTVQVQTARGTSQALTLGLGSPWKKSAAKTYKIQFSADVVLDKGNGNLTLWLPLPLSDETLAASLHSSVPLPPGRWDRVLPLRWEGLSKGKKTWDLQIDVTAFSWESRAEGASDDKTIPEGQGPGVGEGSAFWKALVAKWGADSGDPLARAKKIYTNLVQSFKLNDELTPVDPKTFDPQAIWEGKSVSVAQMSRFYAALCRTSGLGARVVNGFLALGGTLKPHSWCEVWVPGAGWVPVDPFMGVAEPDKHFASMDNDHIPWAWGPLPLPRFDSDSRLVVGSSPFPWLANSGEVSGNLEVSSVTWKAPRIVSTKEESF